MKSHSGRIKSGRRALFDQIDGQLSKNNIVSIGYDVGLLYDIDREDKILPHESVVVGRRFNSNHECEYLIRNSWGRGCAYDLRLTCDEGNVWVPKSVLVKGLIRVSYIE